MVPSVLETFTLDQLRALIAVIEEGSFSAAARKLHRVQSAISTSMANLEHQLGVPLWDRSTKVARLTDQGQAVELAGCRREAALLDHGDEGAQLVEGERLRSEERRVGR